MKAAQGFVRDLGPRRVGGVYRDGYWGTTYTVLAIEPSTGDWRGWEITIRRQDGTVARHSTAWDPRRDRIIQQPA